MECNIWVSVICFLFLNQDRDILFDAQAAPALGVGRGTCRAGKGKSEAGFYHSQRPRKQRPCATVKRPRPASEDNDDCSPRASPSMQFRKKQVRDRKFADARAGRHVQEVVSDD